MSGIPLSVPDWGAADAALHGAVDRARRNWRRRVLLEGLAWTVTAVLATLVVMVAVSVAASVTPATLTVLRFIFVLLAVASVAWWIIRPLLRRVDDARIALYYEERDPRLGQALLSAVESIVPAVTDRPSPALARRLAMQATAALDERDDGRSIELPRMKRAGLRLGATIAVALGVLLLGPASWRNLARGFLVPWTPAEAIVPSRAVLVEPGDRTVPRGASLDIEASAIGFAPGEALLYFRRESQEQWDVLPMIPDSAGHFTLRLFDLDSTLVYAVEAGELRSREHRITVTDLPAVRRVGLELDFPSYTGLETEVIEEGGDVAAVVGTVAEVRPSLTMPVRGGELRFDDGTRIPFVVTDSLAPVARFRVQKSGFYAIDLTAPDGTVVPGTVRWAVDALPDRPPVVRVLEPGRDTRATNVEEVSLAVAADDDYGVRSLALRYTVNGGAEQAIMLGTEMTAGTLTPREVHTLFLEEMSLAAGDLVAYYAVATDGAGNEARSDLYFIEIRPFSRNYRQSEQGGGGGGGGGGGAEPPQELSKEQRDLIVATFNVQRDSATTERERLTEDVATVAVGQERLRERVKELSTEMVTRGAAAVDSTFIEIKQSLDSAGSAMDAAVRALRGGRLAEAVPAEQRALQQLQRAEALYRDVELQMNQGGGGGGGGGGAAPEDLADLFELERDQLRNQYEAVQRESNAEPEAAREVDAARERLRDLARRLEQENERQQRMAEAMAQRLGQQGAAGGSGSGGGASGSAGSPATGGANNSAAQRRFAQEAEEEARRLERLARERNTPELQQAAQAARQAADALRRAAAGEQGGAQEAVEALRGATREVAAGQESSARRETQRLADEAADLTREQAEFTREAGTLPPRGDPARAAALRQLQQEGAAIARDARELQDDLEQASREVRATDPRAAAGLSEGAQRMREFQVPERIEQGNRFVADDRFAPQAVRQYNEQIGRVLTEVRDRVAQAAGSVGTSPERRQERAMERARELVRGMESMAERGEAAARAGEQGQGQQGEGQQGQNPQGQGQQGQGQQGQGQQGQGQGQGQQGRRGEQAGQGQGGADPGRFDGSGQPGGATTGGQQAGGGDARQLGREVQVRLGAAEELRGELREQGITITSLEEAIATMRRLQQDRVLGDPTELARLQQQALESLREAEFDLWRRLGGGAAGLPAVGDPSRVPPRYRQLVEEYYRAIARERP